jgi:hypothetical protein
MHDDEQIKKNNDLEEDEKNAEDVHDDEFLIRQAGTGRGGGGDFYGEFLFLLQFFPSMAAAAARAH